MSGDPSVLLALDNIDAKVIVALKIQLQLTTRRRDDEDRISTSSAARRVGYCRRGASTASVLSPPKELTQSACYARATRARPSPA